MDKENKFVSPGVLIVGPPETYIDAKTSAIAFAVYVSNAQVLDDFWLMDSDFQEKIYEEFIKGNLLE